MKASDRLKGCDAVFVGPGRSEVEVGCPLLARCVRCCGASDCQLPGVKLPWRGHPAMSQFDPLSEVERSNLLWRNKVS